MNRLLSPEFEHDLFNGLLKELHEYVLSDKTLMLAIRENSLNVYYRGGNLLKLAKKTYGYDAQIDENYGKKQPLTMPHPPNKIETKTDIAQWLSVFPTYKQIMDFRFSREPETEREYQQVVAKVNNLAPISSATDYFIADVELPDNDVGAKFDMLAFKWPCTSKNRRQSTPDIQLALIEMKYGNNALKGNAGIADHLKQFEDLLNDQKNQQKIKNLAESQIIQINQLNRLGMFDYEGNDKGRIFNLKDSRYEVIFLFGGLNLRSSTLLKELTKVSTLIKSMESFCDVRFFVPTSAGFALYASCMFNIDAYIEFLEKSNKEE